MNPVAIWLDLETTGLVPEKHCVLEVAACAVDKDFNKLHRYEAVIHHSGRDLDDFIVRMHTKNNLLKECLVSIQDVAKTDFELAKFLNHNSPDELAILAGDSIHFDKGFIKYHFPISFRLCSHRMIDVSSVHLTKKLFAGGFPPKLDDTAHRAAADIDASIAKLKELLK